MYCQGLFICPLQAYCKTNSEQKNYYDCKTHKTGNFEKYSDFKTVPVSRELKCEITAIEVLKKLKKSALTAICSNRLRTQKKSDLRSKAFGCEEG